LFVFQIDETKMTDY